MIFIIFFMMIIINIIVSIVENWSVMSCDWADWTEMGMFDGLPIPRDKAVSLFIIFILFGVSILFLTYDVLEMLLFLLVCLQKSVCLDLFSWWVGEVFKIYLGFWVIVSNFLIIFLLISRFCMFNSSFWGKFVHICAKLKTILSFFIIVENNVSLAPWLTVQTSFTYLLSPKLLCSWYRAPSMYLT